MRGFVLMGCVAGVLVSGSAAAAEGVNLSWDDCGTLGVASKTFACNTNEGPAEILVASFAVSEDIPNFSGFSAQIDIRSTSSELPDWWKHGDPFTEVGCRDTTGLDVDNANTSCPSATLEEADTAGGYAYQSGFASPSRARFVIQFANPGAIASALTAGIEYLAVRVLLHHEKTIGPGACSGCEEAVCIVFNNLELLESPPRNPGNLTLTTPLNRSYVTWQAAMLTTCPESTPARRSTWGSIKSLYR